MADNPLSSKASPTGRASPSHWRALPSFYLDAQATTPMDPRVMAAMAPFWSEVFGNPASRTHGQGWAAEAAVDQARAEVAALVGGHSEEIIFTSGATESNHLALLGVVGTASGVGRQVITQATEHKSILDCVAHQERQGVRTKVLPVDERGQVDPEALGRAINDQTVLVSVMLANNEIGTVQPVAEIGAICRRAGVAFHCDAAQGAGMVPLDVQRVGVDLASLSAHKQYGPKGVGALWVRKKTLIKSAGCGGHHERGLRPGTLNVPAIVGFGEAARISREEGALHARHLTEMAERLLSGLRAELGEDVVVLNGHPQERLPGNLNVSIRGVEGETLLMALPDIAAATGSACNSANLEPSHVLSAIGVNPEQSRNSIRLGLTRGLTTERVDRVVSQIVRAVVRLKSLK